MKNSKKEKDKRAALVVNAKELFAFVDEKIPSFTNGASESFKEKVFDTAFFYLEAMIKEYKTKTESEVDKRSSTSYLYLLSALFDIANTKKYITDGVFSQFGGFFSTLINW